MIASTSGTSTTASRTDSSDDVTDGPTRLCIARMYIRSAYTEARITPNFQIFASDLDEDALAVARRGLYLESIAGDMSAERLRRFFTKADDQHYQVNKRLRESVVFAPRIRSRRALPEAGLISCNLLIYIEPEVQKKVMSLFHSRPTRKGSSCSPPGDGRPA
jgi:two-component system CheB/CheR fusion protein